ncbi:MAG: hypothetical protein Unbinned5930contig1000_15 [Prokaryotic dsDNA virus sp.]|nr:MAG: hypothetical protein Unbinned5930contig1000_15 [Prokaryotic dsDNA virus sp.]|tara:strand:- start:3653 stop:3976 length:324 start_codon:yes stop_codon:yes gene_type:complete
MKNFYYKNKKSYPSKKTNGTMYYIFFRDDEKSYRTCIDSGYRNFAKWKLLIENAIAGDVIRGLSVKSKGLIDADSTPVWTGHNIYEDVKEMEIAKLQRRQEFNEKMK